MPVKKFKTDDLAKIYAEKMRKQGVSAHVIGLKRVWKVKVGKTK
jgi:hypothetical protein